MMGCIYRRGNTYWIKYYRNGKQFAESTHTDKLEIAKRTLKKKEGEIAEGKMPGIFFDRVSFDELAVDLVTDYRINKRKSQERAAFAVKHLTSFLAACEL